MWTEAVYRLSVNVDILLSEVNFRQNSPSDEMIFDVLHKGQL